jgi:hypothetical protein
MLLCIGSDVGGWEGEHSRQAGPRAARPREFRDVIAGLVTGLFSIPEGMEAATAKVLQARGLVQLLGPDDVVPQSDRLFAATEEDVARGQQCIAANRDTPSAD